MVTAELYQERRGVTTPGLDVEERNFASDAEVLRYWSQKLYEAQTDYTRGGSIFALLGPIGVLQRFGATQHQIDSVIRASTRHLPFPSDLFPEQLAA